MLTQKQRDILLTGDELNEKDEANNLLVVGYDSIQDSKRKMEILLNRFEDQRLNGNQYRGNRLIMDRLKFVIADLTNIEKEIDSDLCEINPHLEDVRVAND